MKVLVTGSSGLIGSESVEHFDRLGHDVFGMDNNMRRIFFGPAGDTLWNLERLKRACKRFTHVAIDIRDRAAIEEVFGAQRFDLIVHCAAQPSHDKAREIPLRSKRTGNAQFAGSDEATLSGGGVRLSQHE